MMTLIGDLIINQYFQDGYHLRVTTFRKTGELASIIVDSEFLGDNVSEVYYGSRAKDLLKVLTGYKVAQAMGLDEKMDLSDFTFKGIEFQTSNENN